MIEAGLEFVDRIDLVMEAFSSLPEHIRPIYFSHGELISSDFDRFIDKKRFSEFLNDSNSGFFLLGECVKYSIRIISGKYIICDCFLDVDPHFAIEFLKHMSTAFPYFGFACEPSEREWRNRLVVQQGENSITGWVGRDSIKYLPGIYWLTLISDELAMKHNVSYSILESYAYEHIRLSGQNLFRFYEKPTDWPGNPEVSKLYNSIPSLFHIEKIRNDAEMAKNFIELNLILRAWR